MDYRRINSHIVLLGMVIVVGLFAAIIVRMSMLKNGVDGGTANLIFVLILGASAVLYLIIISTLSNSVIPWIMKRLPAPKKKAGAAHYDDLLKNDDEDDNQPGQNFDYGDVYLYIGGDEYGSDEPDGEDSGEEGKGTVSQIAIATASPTTAVAPASPKIDWKEQWKIQCALPPCASRSYPLRPKYDCPLVPK